MDTAQLLTLGPLGILTSVILATLLSWILYTFVYNLYISPLAAFPGPRSWAVSRIPQSWSVLNGHHHLDVLALHEKYGPVVRLGPDELAFFTPASFRDIYGFRHGHAPFLKNRKYYGPPPNGADHLVSAVDPAVHQRHRKLLAAAFSERALRDQEGLIQGYVDTLVEKLGAEVGTDRGAVIDIKSWLNYTTFDITGDLMFAESFHCLENSQSHPWIELIFESVRAIAWVAVINHFPLVRKMVFTLLSRSIKEKALGHFQLSVDRVERRLKMGSERPDFMSRILKNGFSEDEGSYVGGEKKLSRAELHSEAFILILAGSETSASVLSGSFYYLLSNPHALHRLTDEIRGTFSNPSDITFASTARLPYLSAVIEESLRMYPPLVTKQARLAPAGGATVAGHFVPGGTAVASHHYASYRSTANWHEPERFAPERWLPEERKGTMYERDVRDVLQPFSLGPANCLGRNLAYAEMRVILAKLVWAFEWEIEESSRGWVERQEVYFLWDKPALRVRLGLREGESGQPAGR